MVDDLHDLRLLQPGDGLRRLVVVDEHDALAVGPQQMIARERADHAVVLVEDRVAAVACAQRGVAHIVEIVVEVEGDEVVLLAQARDRDGLDDQARRPVCVERRTDHAGVAAGGGQLPVNRGLAYDDAGGARLHCGAHRIRLVAAENDGPGRNRPCGGARQRNDQLTGQLARLRAIAEQPPVET